MTAPAHPGVFLRDELKARGMTQAELARRVGFHPVYINDLINGRRRLSVQMALALESVLGTDARALLNLQTETLLERARRKRRAGT